MGRRAGGGRYGILARRPLGGGIWTAVANAAATRAIDPADSDGNATQRPGQLFLTSDAGASWHRVRF